MSAPVQSAFVVELPLRTVSLKNVREHWARRAKRTKEHRAIARMAVAARKRPSPPCVVTLIRLAPRRLDDDNVRLALSACRDGVADALGVNDGDPRVEWLYAQYAVGPGVHGVRIEIRPRGES